MPQGNAALSVVGGAEPASSGDLRLRGLVLLAQFHGIAADAAQLLHASGQAAGELDDAALVLAARGLGLKAKIVDVAIGRQAQVALPAMAVGEDGDVTPAQDEKLGLVFPVRIHLDRSTLKIDGVKVSLSTGMSLSAEIKTGKRRVPDYLLGLLQQHAEESLRER
jgi:ABC-type bacteriocin/lantibiotic exporter with double-glycine peptidase domain